jgi:histone H3/H4
MSAEEQNELVALPVGLVRKLMKEDAAHVHAVTQEASLLVAKAAELFVESLTACALECKTGDGKLSFSDLGALCRVAAL